MEDMLINGKNKELIKEMKYQIISNDIPNISNICNQKCLSSLKQNLLAKSEVECIKICTINNIERNSIIIDQIFNFKFTKN